MVMAAQGQVAEEYAKNSDDNLADRINEDEVLNSIRNTAGVAGTIYNKIVVNADFLVSYLEYETDKNIRVIYDRGHNPVYRIVETALSDKTTNGQEHYDSLIDKMGADHYLEDGRLTEELLSKVKPTDNANNNSSKVVQNYFKDQIGDGENYPALSASEKEKFETAMKDQGIGGSFAAMDKMVWKPVVTREGEIILVADTKGRPGDAMAGIIYYNGNYYFHQNGNGAFNSVYIKECQGKNESDWFSVDNITEQKNWYKMKL